MSPALQAGRYKILENLGVGATCRVDKALDTVIGRTVALKSFLQGFGRNSEQQFLNEAQTVGRLSHSSIAQLYDVGTDASGNAFLVMEFVSGHNLEYLLAQGPIPFATAAVWAADVAKALSYAHRTGIIHGDVKPSNIRVTENENVKLIDFGVARFAAQVSRSDRVLGTPAYLSPEQIQGQKQDSRSDLFSLGIVLYEMITGARPFAGDSLGDVCAQILTADPIPPSKRNSDLPKAFDRIIARCLAKNRDERYQSGNDLARALYLVARYRKRLGRKTHRPFWLLRPAQPRDLLAITSAILMIAGVATASILARNWLQSHITPPVPTAPLRAEAPTSSVPRQIGAPSHENGQSNDAVRKTSPRAPERRIAPAVRAPHQHEVSAEAGAGDRSLLR